jgi:hypothetical protein
MAALYRAQRRLLPRPRRVVPTFGRQRPDARGPPDRRLRSCGLICLEQKSAQGRWEPLLLGFRERGGNRLAGRRDHHGRRPHRGWSKKRQHTSFFRPASGRGGAWVPTSLGSRGAWFPPPSGRGAITQYRVRRVVLPAATNRDDGPVRQVREYLERRRVELPGAELHRARMLVGDPFPRPPTLL